jgi:hypothetical protein
MAKIKDIEEIINREVKLIDYEPVEIFESLNEETLSRIIHQASVGVQT